MEREIFCRGPDGDAEAWRQQKEFERDTVKNELLIQLGLENMNFPATAVPVELQRVRQECSQLAWCFAPARLAAPRGGSV